MIRVILLCAAIVSALTSNTTEKNGTSVAKREILEFYPDWVPFKNKHGDELGEFVDVVKPKSKVKKRLALPMNFLIRPIADDGDYPGQGESEGEDYYDKKDWSDVNRPVYNFSDPTNPKENISDIDGVINIITQVRPDLAAEIKKSTPRKVILNQDEYEEDAPEEKINITSLAEDYTTTIEPELKVILTPKNKLAVYNEYEDDSESANNTTQQSEDEQKENEKKKQIILDSVDQLKLRHEQEQKAISEKNQQDEYDNELRHRNIKMKKSRGSKRPRGKPTPPNYDEYEDLSWKDKYNINIQQKPSTETTTERFGSVLITEKTTPVTTTTTTKYVESKRAKYSVFRNPSLYTIDDDDDESLNLKKPPNPPQRFSSKYSSAPANIEHNSAENFVYPPPVATTTERVEPILYFPKMKLKRKLKRVRSTTTAPDSYVAETVEDKLTNNHTTQPTEISYPDATTLEATEDYKTTAIENDYPTSTASIWKDYRPNPQHVTVEIPDKEESLYPDTSAPQGETTAGDTTGSGPSGEAETSNSETVTDAVPASSHHAKEEPKDYHVEKGGGREHHSEHQEEHEEHGKKAYEGLHKNSKTKKGHHDKENHHGQYEDSAGQEKEHHDESGHYGAHHHEEHGKKHAKYEESGKHSKGHSTKGSHDIHKKEEYEKKVEFFEEEGDSGEEEKHGGYHNEKEHKSGGMFKKGKLLNDHHEKKKGESGHFVKGGYHDVNKGHKVSGGHDSHGKHGGGHHGAGGHQSGKKWVYHHGHPAKNANLVVIDRRTDAYMHGPRYYG